MSNPVSLPGKKKPVMKVKQKSAIAPPKRAPKKAKVTSSMTPNK